MLLSEAMYEVRHYGEAGLLDLGQDDGCLDLLKQAIQYGDLAKGWAETDIAWDDYRDDPHLEALLA